MRPYFWPTCGEYPLYDELLYSVMAHDEERVKRYRTSVHSQTPGRVVLDIGTGQDLLWAKESLVAGAAKVYAVESDSNAYDRALEWWLRMGELGSRFELLREHSTRLRLSERVDVCISEIIGMIGSAEGVIVALNDARRRMLKADGVMIPARCDTLVAAVRLPDETRESPIFGFDAVDYVDKVFEFTGHIWDLRLGIGNLSEEAIVSSVGVIETLDFRDVIPESAATSVELTIESEGLVDGVILWIRLWCDLDQEPLDIFRVHGSSWLPLFVPCLEEGTRARRGESITVTWSRDTSENGVNPDYRLEARLLADGVNRGREISMPHCGSKRSGFWPYSKLIRDVD